MRWRSADDLAGPITRRLLRYARNAEVHQNQRLRVAEHHVVRLHVAMHDAYAVHDVQGRPS